MERILTYKIAEADGGLTIGEYLQKKGYSAQTIKELKKMERSILINGVWEYVRHKLSAGEELTIHIQEEASSEKIPPVKLYFEIVYEDEDILVVNKPADMPIHPSLNNYYNSLANGLAYYFEEQGKPFIFRCVNRLDRDTSGLTIIAKHMLSAGILSGQVANRDIHREYLAIVRGIPTPAEGTIDAPIARKEASVIERVVDFEKGDRAVTHYKTIQTTNGHSLLSIHLETGRTHQIRVHMKHIGCPLIGDYLYNPDMEHMSRQALHSHRLVFTHPITGETMDFTAPLPEDMDSVLSS
ncbi:MAG: RluA family pseudouridine synthase [Lachnospiraceae bacterium]|nr:RluA family pseudouridine synthase [Lachnospiraceae bacterium]